MDNLKTIIETLSAEDKREFTVFIRRQKKSKNRKDFELFKILQEKKDYKAKEVVAKLYPEKPNTVAYHALRKRLIRHLLDFIVLKRMDEDTSSASSVMGMISMSQYLLGKGRHKLAWQFLKKGEKQAQESEQFHLLNTIYNLQIEYSVHNPDEALQLTVVKWEENKRLADEDERATIANSLIQQSLDLVKLTGGNIDFEKIIREVLEGYGLSEAVSKRPRLFFNLMSIARSAALVKKDYHAFAPFLVSKYEEFEQQHGFSQSNLYYKLNLLYMVSHVLYRSKQFDESIQYLDLLLENLSEGKKAYFEIFYPKYCLLLAANLVFSNQSEKATEVLEQMREGNKYKLSDKEEIEVIINLGFYYFQQEKHEKAARCLRELNRSDQYYEKKMGREWVIKKNMSEMIFYYDFGDYDLAINKLRTIERNYVEVFAQPNYQNVKPFIQLIKLLFKDPSLVSKPNFMEIVDNSLQFLPFEEEDLQAVSFYAWLKSKMTKKGYYETLLALTNDNKKEDAKIN